MVAGDDGDASPQTGFSPDFFDRAGVSRQAEDGEASQGEDHFWAHGLDLFKQEILAVVDFLGQGVAVVGRATFDDVGDIDFVTLHANGMDHFVQQFSGIADKRFSMPIFFGSRSFSDEQHVCFDIADAEYHVGAQAGQFASGTKGEGCRHGVQFFLSAFGGQIFGDKGGVFFLFWENIFDRLRSFGLDKIRRRGVRATVCCQVFVFFDRCCRSLREVWGGRKSKLIS